MPTTRPGRRPAHGASLVAAFVGFETDVPGPGVPSDPQALRVARHDRAGRSTSPRLADQFPVLIQLEDLHWADDGSLRWLEAADAALHDKPVLVVATARPQLREERPQWGRDADQQPLEHHTRMWLQPLAREDARKLVRDLLRHVEHPPDALVDLVHRRRRAATPSTSRSWSPGSSTPGVIVRGDAAWRVVPELVGTVAGAVNSLRGWLQARLDALSNGGAGGLLQRASVVGRVFWDDAVDRLAPGSALPGDAWPSPTTLDRSAAASWSSSGRVSSFDSAREFLFKHALLRDVAYDGVLRSSPAALPAPRAACLALRGESARSGREDEYAALDRRALRPGRRPGPPAAWYFRAGQQGDVGLRPRGGPPSCCVARSSWSTEDPVVRFDVLATRECDA